MIENTQDPRSIEALALLAFANARMGGDASALIEGQERAGQAQLAHSDRLPTSIHGDRAEFEALGFSFGEPDARDSMFMPATLPEGWKREGSGHAMWSYILDQQGRRRVSIFYKAAFYDRDAFMSLNTVYGYVGSCVYDGKDIVADDAWATPAAVAEAARKHEAYEAEQVEFWTGHDKADRAAEYAAKRDRYAAVAARYGASSDA
jgi:hypothetical protein